MNHIENLKAIGMRINEVAKKNDLQIIAYKDQLRIQPGCYTYDEPTENKNEYYNLDEDDYMATCYPVGDLKHPQQLNLLKSDTFMCITHFYYRRIRRVLREIKHLQDYLSANGLTIDYETDTSKELMHALGFRQSPIWKCWTKDVPVHVRRLIVTGGE